jgi:Zn-dependent protease with chaperone function
MRKVVLFMVLIFSFLKLHGQNMEENNAQIDEIKQQLTDQNLNLPSSPELTNSQNELYKKKHKQKIEAELKMLNSNSIIATGELYAKVNSIFDRILKLNPEIPQNTRLVLYRSNDFNAFTMGDNIIFVHVGLLNDLKNEAQIALVLSHEIAHNTLRHVEESLVESIKNETDKTIEKEINGILKTSYGQVSALNALLLPRILDSREKSRIHEFEADSLGLMYLIKAQFNYTDALSMFHAMEKRSKNTSDSLNYQTYFHFQSIPSIETLDSEYVRESSLGTFTKDESKLPYLATHPYDRERFYKLAKILNSDTTFSKYAPNYDENYKLLERQVGIEMIQNSWVNKNFSEVIYHSLKFLENHGDNKEVKEDLMLAFKALSYFKKKRIAGKYLQLQNPKFPEDFDRICALSYAISPSDCDNLFSLYKNEIPTTESPRNELLEIILLAESDDYPTLDVFWKENKEAIYLSNYSFILEEIERYLYANKKLTFAKPKYK